MTRKNFRTRTPLPRLSLPPWLSGSSRAADWSDNSIRYCYGNRFTEPGIDQDVAKPIIAFTHVRGHEYVSNFLNVDTLNFDSSDPAKDSNEGAQERLVCSHQVSLSKVSGVKLAAGPMSDIAISAGVDFGAKNTAFAAAPRKLMLGRTVKFSALVGWAELNLPCNKEENNNGIAGTRFKSIRPAASPTLGASRS
ncbi:hypothetical protein [Niveibacterium sp.]|uniref:hypothetical protein n=1 Tax=Niveibacterium sp. TaxID=2017444 RepID=UPI0035AEFFD5